MKAKADNPFAGRLEAFRRRAAELRLDVAFVSGEANVRSLTGVACDNAKLVVETCPGRGDGIVFYTDFRYIPMVHRTAPWLKVRDIHKASVGEWRRIGYEGSMTAAGFLEMKKSMGGGARFVDIADELLLLRAVKTPEEIARIAAAEALNDRIWAQTQREIKPGMTEKDVQRVIRAWMNALGDGEAFETIVCAGANAAECHHVPDATVWRKGEPLLVDMGVKLDGVCADMTRCLKPARPTAEYERAYAAVLAANRAAVNACRPGMTGRELDAVARKSLKKAGYGKEFGHSLGHGVGYEIHEWPVASKKSETVLEPGMCVTIEPGVYIEGKLGVRIEDLVLVTKAGCEVLSASPR